MSVVHDFRNCNKLCVFLYETFYMEGTVNFNYPVYEYDVLYKWRLERKLKKVKIIQGGKPKWR